MIKSYRFKLSPDTTALHIEILHLYLLIDMMLLLLRPKHTVDAIFCIHLSAILLYFEFFSVLYHLSRRLCRFSRCSFEGLRFSLVICDVRECRREKTILDLSCSGYLGSLEILPGFSNESNHLCLDLSKNLTHKQ